jgi:hypothetical protein
MNMAYMTTNTNIINGIALDRRKITNRRTGQGRRNLIRFDETGGDRRAGYARRSLDEGFRERSEENLCANESDVKS